MLGCSTPDINSTTVSLTFHQVFAVTYRDRCLAWPSTRRWLCASRASARTLQSQMLANQSTDVDAVIPDNTLSDLEVQRSRVLDSNMMTMMTTSKSSLVTRKKLSSDTTLLRPLRIAAGLDMHKQRSSFVELQRRKLAHQQVPELTIVLKPLCDCHCLLCPLFTSFVVV